MIKTSESLDQKLRILLSPRERNKLVDQLNKLDFHLASFVVKRKNGDSVFYQKLNEEYDIFFSYNSYSGIIYLEQIVKHAENEFALSSLLDKLIFRAYFALLS